jgi:gluconokinase
MAESGSSKKAHAYIVMGVAGCGKTTVGKILADRLNIPFFDADQFHPAQNVEKMSRGISLDDNDREPWLKILSAKISQSLQVHGAVLACSALKEKYRRILKGTQGGQVTFIYLQGSRDLIYTRMQERKDHFMPVSLLDSQFAVLEEPIDAITVSIEQPPLQICETIVKTIGI